MSSSWSYLDAPVLSLLVGDDVLDVGCGMGRWGALIETNYWEARLERAPAVDGLDAFEPNLEHCRARGTYRRLFAHRLPDPLEGTWDTVLAGEVLEHVPPADLPGAVTTLERAARRRVLITTPNGPCFRDGHETPLGFNADEAHVSALDPAFFLARGYTVRGVGLGAYDSRLARGAKRLRVRGSLMSVTWRLPRFSETLVAFKDVGS
jgi:SAM-dependent methyltransferase